MKMKVVIILIVVFLPMKVLSWDQTDFSAQALKVWSKQIQSQLDVISKNVNFSDKDGYYWYLFGSMKYASVLISNSSYSYRAVPIALDQLRRARPVCLKIFSNNDQMAQMCVQSVDSSINGPN